MRRPPSNGSRRSAGKNVLSVRELLKDLIAIRSVNGRLEGGDSSGFAEAQVAEYIGELGKREGLLVEQQRVNGVSSNVVLKLFPAGEWRQTVLLAPHLDTVGLAGGTEEIFTPRESDGRIHGRGACDTKGSVAAMLGALFQVARSPRRPRHTAIWFAGMVDEESGQAGSRAFAAQKLRIDLAIVGEPTNLRVMTAHKGDVWLDLIARGRSAHGARPELGRNAVHLMARVVDALETEYAESLRGRSHPLLGSPTINVGAIRGGSQPNIVPDFCLIQADRRTLPGEDDAGVEREVLEFLAARGFQVEICNQKLGPCPALETDANLPLVRELFRAARQREPEGAQFFCDAAILASGGIPSVVFGPGDIAQAHTADEWIELKSLEAATAILFEFLQGLS